MPQLPAAPRSVVATAPAEAAPVAVAPAADGGGNASVHRAARDRRLNAVETTASTSAEQQQPSPGGVPAPDIEALARQVYGVLRRRLAAERRRAT